jgi:hypothetical protein
VAKRVALLPPTSDRVTKETGAKAVVPGLFGEQGGWLSASGRKFRPITLLVGTGSIDAVTSIPFSR